ncbi:glycoside hydrolase [Rhizoclosmatium globosum]|uniref:Glycoside hydrolase n=1 Tax=Rhizoclosmatium globosum TaxID=329046 RepID=A0A1Y2C8N0_9FUNG|nr:glycoside hydrolase [Rhizoclosmatium globosum]|eukprot:ORY43267.1 glycoside hydrolase [Rhizoclosmatium globosum]
MPVEGPKSAHLPTPATSVSRSFAGHHDRQSRSTWNQTWRSQPASTMHFQRPPNDVYSLKLRICFCLFWAKSLLAATLFLSCMFFYSWKVYSLHIAAIRPSPPQPETNITIVDPKTGHVRQSCFFNASAGFARVQPQIKHSMVIGFSLDWSYETPTALRNKLDGHSPLIFNAFMGFDANITEPYDRNMLNWYGSEVGRVQGILEVTMMPMAQSSSLYTDSMYDQLGKDLASINSKYKTPVLLRFGHEMNGDWTVYGNKPTDFIKSFRRMAKYVRKYTNMTAMVWGPNIGITYPFNGGGMSESPTSGPDFLLLDTNHDGKINSLDDPYTPFYPGDDVVDWVALSLYYYPFDDCRNCPVPNTYFVDYLTGSGPTTTQVLDPQLVTDMHVYQRVHDFYHMFCTPQTHNKPMLLPETGSPFIPQYVNGSDPSQWSESQIKMGWWNQVLNATILDQFPNLIAAVNFEEAKELGGVLRDWRLTNTSAPLKATQNLLSNFGSNLHQSTDFEYGCDGSVKLKSPS